MNHSTGDLTSAFAGFVHAPEWTIALTREKISRRVKLPAREAWGVVDPDTNRNHKRSAMNLAFSGLETM